MWNPFKGCFHTDRHRREDNFHQHDPHNDHDTELTQHNNNNLGGDGQYQALPANAQQHTGPGFGDLGQVDTHAHSAPENLMYGETSMNAATIDQGITNADQHTIKAMRDQQAPGDTTTEEAWTTAEKIIVVGSLTGMGLVVIGTICLITDPADLLPWGASYRKPKVVGDTRMQVDPGAAVTFDVLRLATPYEPSAPIDKTSVQLRSVQLSDGSFITADTTGKKLTVKDEGVWSVETNGDIKFTPDAALVGSPTKVTFTVADTQHRRSEPGILIVTYRKASDPKPAPVVKRPKVFSRALGPANGPETPSTSWEFDVINGFGKGARHVIKGDNDIDPASVKLLAVMTSDTITTTLSTDHKTLKVSGQGTWTAKSDGKVTFVPEATFSGEPYPVRFSISDNGSPATDSLPAYLIVSAAALKIFDFDGPNFTKETDKKFFIRLDNNAFSTGTDLWVAAGTVIALTNLVAKSMPADDFIVVNADTVIPNDATFAAEYLSWVKSGYDLDTLFQQSASFIDGKQNPQTKKTPFDSIALGDRYIRLNYLRLMFNKWRRDTVTSAKAAAGGHT